jgi:hypothetical protein
MAQDFLKECLQDLNLQGKANVPIDVLQKDYCIVCLNRDCSRSGVSQGSFVQRTQSWEKTLFISPTRAPDNDPYVQKTLSAWGSSESAQASRVFVPPNFVSVEPAQVSRVSDPVVDPATATLDNVPNVATPMNKETPDPPKPVSPKPKNPFAPGYVGPKPEESEVVIESGGSFTFG